MTQQHFFARDAARAAMLAEAAQRLIDRHNAQRQAKGRTRTNEIPAPQDNDPGRRTREEVASIAAEISRRLDLRNNGSD